VIAGCGQLLDVGLGIGGGEAVHLAAEFFPSELGLMGRAAADPVQHLPKLRKTLNMAKHFSASRILQPVRSLTRARMARLSASNPSSTTKAGVTT
jgi:hypothetical protein